MFSVFVRRALTAAMTAVLGLALVGRNPGNAAAIDAPGAEPLPFEGTPVRIFSPQFSMTIIDGKHVPGRPLTPQVFISQPRNVEFPAHADD